MQRLKALYNRQLPGFPLDGLYSNSGTVSGKG